MYGPGHDGGGPPDDRPFGHGQPPSGEMHFQMERERELANRTPTSLRQNGGGYGTPTRAPGSPARSVADRNKEGDPRQSGERNRSRQRDGRTASGHLRTCKKCGEPLTGQFVRALDGTFHLDCFRCRDCNQIVASKFFPADDEDGSGQYPLCETDYFRRLGLLCYQCGGALRGSYITALERKYHVDHFTCSMCSTVFGAQDSYYEHDGHVYCHYHYSTQFAQRCNGCQTAILKQFVEIFRNGQNQHWHPECYMIHKFWNVRLTSPNDAPKPPANAEDEASRELVREEEERMEDKVYRIWSILSTFEESSAACISDMLLHVSNGAYVDGVLVARRFIWHVDLLFQAADRLDATTTRLDIKGLSYSREAKFLCKKIVAFFSLLSKTQEKGSRKLGVTQELLSLVTGLAHYLKLLIRICLQGALRIEKERETSDGLDQFLVDLGDLEAQKPDNDDDSSSVTEAMSRLSANDSDQCASCHKPIEDECARNGDKRWHLACMACTHCGAELSKNTLQDARPDVYGQKVFCATCCQAYSSSEDGAAPPFERVSKLQQYVFLLQVALARLLEILRSTGALSGLTGGGGDPDAPGTIDGGRQMSLDRDTDRDAMRPDDAPRTMPPPYGAGEHDHRRESSYESTLNDVRRLRSTRLDKHLSSRVRKARTSQVMSGPDGPRSGSVGPDGRGAIDEGSTDMMLGRQGALTLDDIPRIVAAEQVREQRQPYRTGRQEPSRSPAAAEQPGPGMDDQRTRSAGQGGDRRRPGEQRSPLRMGHQSQKYFSELSGLEYFIVRHLAVLTMHPMVESEFTLEELLGFIESKKPATFWNKFGKAFQKDGKKAVKKKGTFGVPLEVVIERDGADSTDGVGPGTLRIPAIVDDIVSTMRQMDLSVEGVFRKNGNIKKLSELVEKIDREGCDNISLSSQSVVQVAALLKRYLRELPDPLMTHKLYRLWITAAKIPEEDKRRQCLHMVCCLLPKTNRDCLEILFCFLKWSGSFHQMDDETGSKMDVKNLATVITPNVLHSNSKAMALDSEAMYAIVVVETLITYIETMCLVPEDLVMALNDPSLFNSNGELTTKEILKRIGERTSNGSGRSYSDVTEAVGVLRHHHDNNPGRSFARRVETDPSVWQQDERSVRTVQEPTVPPTNVNNNNNNGGGGSGTATPPQQPRWRGAVPEEGPGPGPGGASYAQQPLDGSQQVRSESGDHGAQRREWRNSGWGRQDDGSTPIPGAG